MDLRRVILRPAARHTPTGIAVSPDGTRAFVIAEGRKNLVVLDVSHRRKLAELRTGPRALGLSADGQRLFVTDVIRRTLAVVDTTSFAVTASVPVGNSPSAVRLSADGSTIYVLHQHATEVMGIVDAATLELVRTVSYPAMVFGEVDLYVPDERHITIPWFDPNWVIVSDSEESNPMSQIRALLPTGLDPFNVAVTADGDRALVTNFSSDTVSVIDLVANRILDTLPLGPPPHGVRGRVGPP